ncbi:MAG TPA: ABC transporter substrate-binding protein [Acidimicrobiia bacterium]|nr:ABC transporter substrate-binding protein [Acidimicrobiia bacterium]
MDEVSILLPFPLGIGWTGLVVGEQLGFFEDENLSITTEATDGGGFVVQQVLAGNVDYGLAAASEAIIAYNRDPGMRAAFCNKSRNIFQITALEGSPIESVSDLQGTVMGISEAGGGEVNILTAILEDAGLSVGEDVELLPIGGAGPAAAVAIEDGTVDAYTSSFPDIINLRLAGVDLRDITPEEFDEQPGDCFLVMEETLEDPAKADIVERISRAWSKGSLYAENNPEEALELACEAVPESCVDEEYAARYWEFNVDSLSASEDVLPGETSLPGWELVAQLLYSAGTTETLVDPAPIISGGIIGEIRDAWTSYDPSEVG